ncbi:hypothetical protein C8R44DRAFT_667061 [Mycena epipterygia]|nr:hypothetical protein C8R44DRAFT_667061 [Mycena epipterygia]
MATFPTDPYERLQANMAHAHDTYRLGYATILRHLEEPPMDDLDNFLGYCRAWASSIVGHHDAEEAVLFPFLNQKLDFSDELAQHVAVAGGLTGIIAYIDAVRSDPAELDAGKLKEIRAMDRDSEFEHLAEEVEDLSADNLKVFSTDELAGVERDMIGYFSWHSEKFITLPFMRSHTPPELKDVWPPTFTWPLKKVVIPYLLSGRHSGYWKYSPYPIS